VVVAVTVVDGGDQRGGGSRIRAKGKMPGRVTLFFPPFSPPAGDRPIFDTAAVRSDLHLSRSALSDRRRPREKNVTPCAKRTREKSARPKMRHVLHRPA
jgi:hypothetical protein